MSAPRFDRPAPPGDRFVNEQNVGQLLAIEVLSAEYGVQTENGPADCIRANVYVISPQGTVAASYMGTLVFGRMLFSRLSQSVGRTVLGVLTGQPGVKVQGKNVPYDLDDPTDAMEATAVRAMMSRPQPQAQEAPAQQWGQQPVAPNGWGAPPAQQGPPPGWGQQPVQQPAAPAGGWGGPPQGPPPGWGQAAAAQQPVMPQPPGGWVQQLAPQQPAQQQIPAPDRPPWETDQPAGPPPWAAGQQ